MFSTPCDSKLYEINCTAYISSCVTEVEQYWHSVLHSGSVHNELEVKIVTQINTLLYAISLVHV